jgi:hypothetical protein
MQLSCPRYPPDDNILLDVSVCVYIMQKKNISLYIYFFLGGGLCDPTHSWGFLDHTQRRTTVGRTLLDKWSACRRDLYLTTQTHTTDKHLCPGWDSNPRSQQASGYWDRHMPILQTQNCPTIKNLGYFNSCIIFPDLNISKVMPLSCALVMRCTSQDIKDPPYSVFC